MDIMWLVETTCVPYKETRKYDKYFVSWYGGISF